MLGRKDYTKAEFDHAQAAVAEQLAAYRKVAKLAGSDKKTTATVAEFETVYFNNLALALVELGRLEEAAAHFKTSLELEPKAEIYRDLGFIMARLGKPTHYEARDGRY